MASSAQRRLTLERPPTWPRARAPKASESQVQAAVLKFLQWHSAVAWCARLNSGAAKMMNVDRDGAPTGKARFVRFSFKGCSDIVGQMKPRDGERAGAFLAVEVKGAGGRPTADQSAFLRRVKENGGLAGVVWSLPDVERIINEFLGKETF